MVDNNTSKSKDILPEESLSCSPPEPVTLPQKLVVGEDYYWQGKYMVFTANYLLKRGYCCQSRCRHCPYGFNPQTRT